MQYTKYNFSIMYYNLQPAKRIMANALLQN